MDENREADEQTGVVPLQLGDQEWPDPREYVHRLWKRRWLIAAVTIVAALASAFYSMSETRLYTAETVLLIERTPPRVMNIEDVLVDSQGAFFYNTQVEILRSRSLAERVIRELELPMSVASYQRGLGVTIGRQSLLVRVSYTSTDPELSARVANAHARAFSERGDDMHAQANEGARRFLDRSLEDLKRRLEESEAALNAFRRETGIVSLDNRESLVVERLVDLNSRLTNARAERIAREADVQQIRNGPAASIPFVVDSPSVVAVRAELTALMTQEISESRSGIPNPSLKALIEDARNRLEREIERVASATVVSFENARSWEDQLAREVEAEKTAAFRLKDASVQYSILAREVDTNQQLYDAVLQRRKEVTVAAELRTSNVVVLDEAYPPRGTSTPGMQGRLAYGLLLGLLGGIALAFAADFLDNSVKTPNDVDRVLGIPYLGTISEFSGLPAESRRWWHHRLARRAGEPAVGAAGSTALLPAPSPRQVTEGYRAIRTGILLSRAGEPPQTILVTSATRGEGKTITSLNLAATFAQMGRPVLIIDADLRHPRCHELLSRERGPGLAELLAGQCEVDQVVSGFGSSLFFLGGGAEAPPDPVELLGSDRMRRVLGSLRGRFHFIVIDAPPVLPVADTLSLSGSVDGVVLVIGRKTPKKSVQKARSRLQLARARVIGAVLNGFDLRDTGEEYSYYAEA